jgi:type IV pilus assembly protein PilW
MTAARHPAPAAVRGFTMVEFLVALAIGLIVSLVIGQIFIGSRQSFSSQEDSARIQENIRDASNVLTRAVRMAGFRNNTAIPPATTFPKGTAPVIAGVDDDPVSGLPSNSADPTIPTTPTNTTVKPDSVTVRFEGSGSDTGADKSVADCQGNYINYNQMVTMTFSIRPVTKDGVLSSSLYCTTDAGTPGNAVVAEIIPNVDNMQLLYGVDTDADGAANAYVRIGDVADIDSIVSVRAWVLMRAPVASYVNVVTATYTLAGVDYTYKDRFSRRVMYTTINLRNRTL